MEGWGGIKRRCESIYYDLVNYLVPDEELQLRTLTKAEAIQGRISQTQTDKNSTKGNQL